MKNVWVLGQAWTSKIYPSEIYEWLIDFELIKGYGCLK